MTTKLTLAIDATDATAAAEELRDMFGDGLNVPRHLRDRVARMLDLNEAIELAAGPRGLMAVPSGEMLAILATLQAHRSVYA